MKYPTKRLIVFAGMTGRKEQIEAFQVRKPDAWMASFGYVRAKPKRDPWNDEILPQLIGWDHLRYLDSGTFTFLRRGLVSRLGMGSRREAEIEANKKRGSEVTTAEVTEHLQAYLDYLKRHLHLWDFVFETDLDGIQLAGEDGKVLDGHDFTIWSREKVLAVAGPKLIPVWHALSDTPDFQKWEELTDRFNYVAIGSDIQPDWRPLRYLIDRAHQKGVLVHGLGTSKMDVLEELPYDTVDSSTWISSARFGQFAGQSFTAKPRKSIISAAEMSRAAKLEDYVKKLGLDPADLLAPYETPAKYIVSIARFQERQYRAGQIKTGILSSTSLDLGGESNQDEGF